MDRTKREAQDMTERVYGEIDHTGYCKRCPDRTRCFVNEGCVQDAHEKKQADARALWAVRVLDARLAGMPDGCGWEVSKCSVGYYVEFTDGTRAALDGPWDRTLEVDCMTPDAARIAAAEALVAEDPSLGEGL